MQLRRLSVSHLRRLNISRQLIIIEQPLQSERLFLLTDQGSIVVLRMSDLKAILRVL